MNVYLIPGLGGDKRMYAGQLSKFPQTKVLEFIEPLKGETISNYAYRLAEGIDKNHPFILVGVSLGGIVAQEIAVHYPPKKTIIISSVKSTSELPLWIRMFKCIPIPKLIPGKLYLWIFMVLMWFKTLGSKRNHIIANLKNMAKDVDPKFVYWAVNQLVKWKNPIVDFKAYHMHGGSDYLFPCFRIKNLNLQIKGGTHVMILTHVRKINEALSKELHS
tara:strand:+ start:2209 stop:2862 length:654 start_codon:yes stop_codon:yes gene_type:complete